MKNLRNYIVFYLNGKKTKVYGESVFKTLSEFLRYDKQIPGTKIVCSEGDCGSCTVVLGKSKDKTIDYKIVNSCIKFVYQIDGLHIITIEGLKQNGTLNPIQESMVKNHGAQCGFCTPGFVVAMTSILQDKKELSSCEIKKGLTGNLCRCTGYESIIKSAQEFDSSSLIEFNELYDTKFIFNDLKQYENYEVLVEYEDKRVFKPLNIKDAIDFRSKNSNTIIISGGTDIGVQVNKRIKDPKSILFTDNIEGLSELKIENDALIVGAKVKLSEFEVFIKDLIPELYEILSVFGSPQIRNAGTLVGNIANGSSIGDTLPFLCVMDAEVKIAGLNGTRIVNINKFYKGYRTLDLTSDELITKIIIPLPKKAETLKLYKVSRRKDLDISTITSAFLFKTENNRIQYIKIAYGGVTATVQRITSAENFLKDKEFSLENLKEAGKLVLNEITPMTDVRASKEFRLQLAQNLLMKLYFDCTEKETALCQ